MRSTFVSSKRGAPRRRYPITSVRALHPKSCFQLVYLGTEEPTGYRARGRSYSRLWSPHGLPLRLWTTSWRQKSLWRPERSITVGRVLFGPTFGDPYHIKIVVSSQSVPHATFYRHTLMFYSLFHGKQKSTVTRDQCVFIRGFRIKCVPFLIKPIRIEADSFLMTVVTAEAIRCK